MGRNRRRFPPRSSIPTELTPRAEWDKPDPDPVVTQPVPPKTNLPAVPDTSLPADLAAAIRAKVKPCAHCLGRHVRACPRVKSMRFHPNGSLAGVDFWAEGKWSDAHVLWDDEMDDE